MLTRFIGRAPSSGDSAILGSAPRALGAADQVITFCELADLVQSPGGSERGATGLLRQLLNARSGREREQVIRQRLDDAGFEWMAYSAITRSGVDEHHYTCMSTYAPLPWLRRYFEQKYHEVDPRQEWIRRCSLPQVWDVAGIEEAVASRPQTHRLRSFVQELRDSGMGSGVFARLPTEPQSPILFATVSLGATVSSRRWIDDRVVGQALVIGLSIHDYVSHHVELQDLVSLQPADSLNAMELPARQQAVLRYVADGLTDREIAQRLGVSLHAVDYYLRQLRQYFAVRNRVQLISAAAHLLT